MHTKTWYHTGVYVGGDTVSRHLAEEYWRENLTADQAATMLLADTVLPDTVLRADGSRDPWQLTPAETRDAARALRGSLLRQEVYAQDGSTVADRPYQVSEHNYTVELLAPRGPNAHAVCLAHARETLTFHYERTFDPRVGHDIVLDVDGYGNVLHSVEIGYPRRTADPAPELTAADRAAMQAAQARLLMRCGENAYTNAVDIDGDTDAAHRIPQPAEFRSYEIVHLKPAANASAITNLFTFAELTAGIAAASDGGHDLAAEDVEATGATTSGPYRRLLTRSRNLYRADDLSASLASGQLEARGLPYLRLRLAATPSQLAARYQRGATDLLGGSAAALVAEGGYVVDGDGWWLPSGRIFYSPGVGDPHAAELAYATQHFFRPCRFTDPFGNLTTIGWDSGDLLSMSSRDPVGNETTVLTADYRMLKPAVVADPNGNRAAVAYDALGRVAGTAVMGKVTGADGDSLAGFDPDPDDTALTAYFADPSMHAAALVGDASTRLVYDLGAYQRSVSSPQPQPIVVATIARTRHVSDPQPTAYQHSLEYSDGLGRLIQRKSQAEPGPVIDGGPDVSPRWVGSGWRVFDNKGNPVRRYEPFFSATHLFEDARAVGVSPVLCYDPLGRVVASVHPDGSYEKTVVDGWAQTSWDRNDTVLLDPRTDADVDGYLARHFAALPPGWRTWYATASAGGTDVQDAAAKTVRHAGTPGVVHRDPLGRSVLAVAHLRDAGGDHMLCTRSVLDVQGNVLSMVDALGRVSRSAHFDAASRPAIAGSADAGVVYTLPDIAGKPIRVWDARGFITRMTYDGLRRTLRVYVSDGTTERLRERTVYGEVPLNAADNNLRTQVYHRYDGAGRTRFAAYDFVGNLTRTGLRLVTDHQRQADWSALETLTDTQLTTALAPGIDTTEEFVTLTNYDALRRPIAVTTADGSVTRPRYNEAALLDGVDVSARGGASSPIVTDINYTARGERASMVYGNGATTAYAYDPATFRLASVHTTRTAAGELQGLRYVYDPVGNVTTRHDDAQQTVFYAGAVVSPDLRLTYDPLYRIVNAGGREHIGQTASPAPDWDDAARSRRPLPGDGQAMRRYTDDYGYDWLGNLLTVTHHATGGNWSRTYAYQEPSALAPAEMCNRLTSTTVGATTETYAHDAHGNLTTTARLSTIGWDDRDRLHSADLGGGGTVYMSYAGDGTRARKVVERQNGSRQYEWIYLPGLDIYRQYDGSGTAVTLERQALHVRDGRRRLALVEVRTAGTDAGLAEVTRYQFADHLGSACLELDDSAAIISYEEYYPFGSTAYQAVRSATETPKRYRYTGRERDGETGFTYHQARYCMSWLGRWTAVDPAGIVDGLNPYVYVRNNPLRMTDPSGRDGEDENHTTSTQPTPRNNIQLVPRLTLDVPKDADLVNLWNASVIQGSGIISKDKQEWELSLQAIGSSQTGLTRQQFGGGLQNLSAALREQVGPLGLDVGAALNVQFLAQGSDMGNVYTRGMNIGPTLHYGIRSKRGLALAGYLTANAGAQATSGGNRTEAVAGSGLIGALLRAQSTGRIRLRAKPPVVQFGRAEPQPR